MSDTNSTAPVQFAIGDKVTYTHQVIRGSRISLSTREGTIIEMNNVVACLKARNGRKVHMPLSRLTKAGQPCGVTRFFKAFCEAVVESGKETK